MGTQNTVLFGAPYVERIEFTALNKVSARVERATKCQIPLAQNPSHSGWAPHQKWVKCHY